MPATKPMRIHAIGLTGLIMANGQLADPDNKYARLIKEITDKGPRMTDEDRRQKDLLQWRGHLYEDEAGQVIIPAANLIRCLQKAATAFRLGTAAQRGIMVAETSFPLQYDGPADIAKLVMADAYTWRAVANLNPTKGARGGKGTKVWPKFLPWSFQADLTIFPELISADDAIRVLQAAGQEGICDARRLGYGKFTVETS